MKGNTALLISFVMFVGLLAYFVGSFAIESNTLSSSDFVNTTDSNVTFITGSVGIFNSQACKFQNNIFLLGTAIDTVGCISDYVGYLFSFISIGSTDPILAIILGAVVVGLLYIGVKLLHPGGG